MAKDRFYDGLLVLGCQRGDPSAYREMVERWQPRLFYFLRRTVEDEAAVWDVIQETWLAVLRNIRQIKDVRTFPAWLYRIAHRKSVDLLRRRSRYTQMVDEQVGAWCENSVPEEALLEQAELLHTLLEKLTPVHREVLTLHFLEEFSIPEMARILDVSEGTVKSRLYYAKKNLLERLERKNHGTE